jgi:hypothetical protein
MRGRDTQDSDALRGFAGPDIAARFEPFVAEWATARCPRIPRVGLVMSKATRSENSRNHGMPR